LRFKVCHVAVEIAVGENHIVVIEDELTLPAYRCDPEVVPPVLFKELLERIEKQFEVIVPDGRGVLIPTIAMTKP